MRSTLGTSSEARKLAKENVLVIGDSFHAIPIIGGEGANTAMEDAIELATHLEHHGTENFDAFFNQRYDVWKKIVRGSEDRLARIHSPWKSSL